LNIFLLLNNSQIWTFLIFEHFLCLNIFLSLNNFRKLLRFEFCSDFFVQIWNYLNSKFIQIQNNIEKKKMKIGTSLVGRPNMNARGRSFALSASIGARWSLVITRCDGFQLYAHPFDPFGPAQ
jgi:hypothetical protein